jgi:mannose-6-phosphate isomerase-like protein (cupin superfamily)|tara:strand:- start:1350 stop:1679 length:330 start_codon:yes stop_codon:yes gene_type:complete
VLNITNLFKTVKEDERYLVEDNTHLKTMVVSKTTLKPEKETTGHFHEGQEEVYLFVKGRGVLETHTELIQVVEGDVVVIDDGDFHKVSNTSDTVDLEFICVFPGERYEH